MWRTLRRTGLVSALLMAAAALALPVASSAGNAGLTAAPAGTRAMWVWDDYPADQLISWSAAKGVSEIFVYVAPDALTNGDLDRLQQLKQRADAQGVRLSALGGEPTWTTDHEAALAWLRMVVLTGVFAGVHLDVEPYLTVGWTRDLQGTEKAYLGLLDAMRAGSTLGVEADVPFWYGGHTVGTRNLADEILKRVNRVTVMSYRDTGTGANSILSVSQDWLARGAVAGKRVRLGAETSRQPDCPYCTFAEEGAARMTTELAKVDTATRKLGAFNGVAIHWYGSWSTMRR